VYVRRLTLHRLDSGLSDATRLSASGVSDCAQKLSSVQMKLVNCGTRVVVGES
jgi:hypothetical protein